MEIKINRKKMKAVVSLLMLGICVVAFVLIANNLLVVAGVQGNVEADLAAHDAFNKESEAHVKASTKARKEITAVMVRKNLFVPPPPKPSPPTVTAILGLEVLIGDKWYKAGDKVNGCEIKSVSLTGCVIVWEDNEKTLTLSGALPASTSAPTSAPIEHGRQRGNRGENRKDRKRDFRNKEVTSATEEDLTDIPNDMFDSIPEKYRERAVQHWDNASPEGKRKMRKRFKDRQ